MVINMTVGRSTARSTGRAILPSSAANGQIYFGAINAPFLGYFRQGFQEKNFLSFSKFLEEFLS